MSTITFTTAVLIFINFWLIALASFGIAASTILLYILGAVDGVIGSGVAVAILCVSPSSPIFDQLSVLIRVPVSVVVHIPGPPEH